MKSLDEEREIDSEAAKPQAASSARSDAVAASPASASASTKSVLLKLFLLNVTIYGVAVAYYNSPFVDARYVNHHISNLIITIPFVCLLLWSYRQGYKALQASSETNIRSISLMGVAAALIAVCIPNFHSSDVFSYIDVGWLQSHYHLNPYVVTVQEVPQFKQDTMFTGVWAWNPCPYGFGFAQLTKWIASLGGGNLQLAMHLMKAVNFAAFTLLAGLIYSGAKLFKVARPELSLYLYLWSPFVLLQSLANAHNDVLMTLPVMTGMLLACTNFASLALASLLLGAQIKFVWLVAVPFLLLFVFRRSGIKALAANLICAIVLLALLSAPYIGDLHRFRFDIMRQDLSFNGASLPALVENIAHAYEKVVYHSASLQWFEQGLVNFVSGIKTGLFIIFATFASLLFAKAIKSGKKFDANALVCDSLLLALLAVCLVSSKFHPWYILMFFPVALWLPERSELRRLCVILSCTQLFAITYLGHSGGINFVVLTASPLVYSAMRVRRRKLAYAVANTNGLDPELVGTVGTGDSIA